MLGVLMIVLGHDPIPGRHGILRQRQILFTDLMGRTADTYIRAIAVKHLRTLVLIIAPPAVSAVSVSSV